MERDDTAPRLISPTNQVTLCVMITCTQDSLRNPTGCFDYFEKFEFEFPGLYPGAHINTVELQEQKVSWERGTSCLALTCVFVCVCVWTAAHQPGEGTS